MTLSDLVQSFNDFADNNANPPLWSDALIESYADQAENEACIRRPLLTTSTDVDMCDIDIVSGTSVYTKHKSVCEVYYAKLTNSTDSYSLRITNIDELNFLETDIENMSDEPKYLLLTDSSVEVVPTPIEDGILEMSISHIPVIPMSESDNPTIHENHHYNLVYWMLHLGYEKQDADTFNAKKSLDYYTRFNNIFGEPRNVNQAKGVRNVRNYRYRGDYI